MLSAGSNLVGALLEARTGRRSCVGFGEGERAAERRFFFGAFSAFSFCPASGLPAGGPQTGSVAYVAEKMRQ